MAALRVLVLNSEITALRAQLTPLEQTRDGFAAREEQLRQALSEITETSTDAERSAVSAAVDAFENDRSANAAEIARIQGEIDARNDEIRSLEAQQTTPPANPPVSNSDTGSQNNHERSFVPMNNTTERRWFGLTYAERDALIQSEQSRTFLQNVRQLRIAFPVRTRFGKTDLDVVIALPVQLDGRKPQRTHQLPGGTGFVFRPAANDRREIPAHPFQHDLPAGFQYLFRNGVHLRPQLGQLDQHLLRQRKISFRQR